MIHDSTSPDLTALSLVVEAQDDIESVESSGIKTYSLSKAPTASFGTHACEHQSNQDYSHYDIVGDYSSEDNTDQAVLVVETLVVSPNTNDDFCDERLAMSNHNNGNNSDSYSDTEHSMSDSHEHSQSAPVDKESGTCNQYDTYDDLFDTSYFSHDPLSKVKTSHKKMNVTADGRHKVRVLFLGADGVLNGQ